MKGQIKRVLAVLLAVLFVATLTASAVSASSLVTPASTVSVSGVTTQIAFTSNFFDDYCGNGFHPFPFPLPGPWPPGPDPIERGQTRISLVN